MKNPLLKRLPKELKRDWGKYLVIFVFMIITIGFVSGFLVADNSMQIAYDDSFEKYNIEDGNFETVQPIANELKSKLEELDIDIYDNKYVQKAVLKNETLRIFKNRDEVNLASIIEGDLPKDNDEIAIDRLYADNNDLKVGDTMNITDSKWKICGLVALSDYSAMFKSNTDFMLDAHKFGVAVVSPEAFKSLSSDDLHYSYSWQYDDNNIKDDQRTAIEDDIKGTISQNAVLTNFIPEEDNQSIHFTGNDIGSDKAMFTWFFYIIIVIMAFVFAITTKNTIETESSVIGTLRASGYSRGEMMRHYLTLPVAVTLISAIIGNILGYTYFKNIMADMYYGSYSLPTYETVWNSEAFIMTTVGPCIVMLVINFLILINKLSISPLQFLRKDLKKNKRRRAVKLPNIKFFTRFRLRILFQNMPNYGMLTVGILFANVLLTFGLMFAPMLDNYEKNIRSTMICDHQYILKAPVETSNADAEKYSVDSLEIYFNDNDKTEDVSIFGVQEDSDYIKNVELPENDDEVIISSGMMEKYGLQVGDHIRLKGSNNNERYSFEVAGSYTYPAVMSIFMSTASFNSTFDKSEGYFNGYYSNEKLKDIDKGLISSEITEADMTNMVDQMNASIGAVFPMFAGFAVLLSAMLIYLISKIVIEKNTTAISMTKILGYSNNEISRLYIVATVFIVVIVELLSLPIAYWVIRTIYFIMMQRFNGWMTFYMAPKSYLYTFMLGIISYGIVTIFQYRRIKKIPKEEALKDME